jgi:hypothetical protein
MDGINAGTTKKSVWSLCWFFKLGNFGMEFTGVIFRRTSIKTRSRDGTVGITTGPESEFEFR